MEHLWCFHNSNTLRNKIVFRDNLWLIVELFGINTGVPELFDTNSCRITLIQKSILAARIILLRRLLKQLHLVKIDDLQMFFC